MRKLFISLVVFLFSCTICISQKKTLQAGIKLTGELTLYDGLAPGAGIQVLYKSSGHSGFETGVFWQKRRYASFFTEGPGGGSLYQSKVFSHRLQIPFLYRFNSKPVNFSIGPVADFPIGKSINTDDPDPALKNFKNYKSTMILTVNFSHTFKLFRVFFLEPEIGFNYLPSRSDGGACINVSLRRTIF